MDPQPAHTTTEERPLLAASAIIKDYPGTRALDRVDFDVRPGEIHALVGENGAGKSTLMQLIAGVIRPDGGVLLLDGRPIHLRSPHDAQRLGISLVFQELALYPNLSVAENVFTNTQPGGRFGLIQNGKMEAETRASLAGFGLAIDPRSTLGRHSVAVQQIVEIARATRRQTRVLLLDEPTSAIGVREIERLFAVLRGLRNAGVGIVYVSHKLNEVFLLADRITVLKDGKVAGSSSAAQLTQDDVVQMMVGRAFSSFFPPRATAVAHPALRVEDVSGPGYQDVSLEAEGGRILGLFGQTGAGRTELAQGIFGVVAPHAGRMWLKGQALHISTPQQAIRHGIAYIPEDRKQAGLFLSMSVKQNIAATNLHAISRWGLIRETRLRTMVDGAIVRLRIKASSRSALVMSLSGGNQQKVLFAKWLQRRPEVLIADEPTRGVDVGAKAEIHALLRESAQAGAAVIVISSELPEIMGLCDRVVVMRAGHKVGEFDPLVAGEEQVLAAAVGATGTPEVKEPQPAGRTNGDHHPPADVPAQEH